MKPYFTDEKAGITLFLGDCREILPTLERGSVDLVLTDPPYGISHSSNHGASWMNTTIASDDDTTARDFIIEWAAGLAMFIFGSWKVQRPPHCKGVLVWDKGPASGMGDLSFPWKMSHEEIYVLGNGFIGTRDEGVLRGHLLVSSESKGRCHPHQKPVSLIAYLLRKHLGETILDPFAGSGTTLRAAKDLGRKAIGIEIEERYCEITARRLEQAILDFGPDPEPMTTPEAIYGEVNEGGRP